ncbi:unnamed protein product, partial [Ascophyllum nodosum]
MRQRTKMSLVSGLEPLVPIGLSTSTFALPAVEHSLREPYLEHHVLNLLADQLEWTPPGLSDRSRMQLWPVNSTVDVDCLFHSVSVALWGCNDDQLDRSSHDGQVPRMLPHTDRGRVDVHRGSIPTDRPRRGLQGTVACAFGHAWRRPPAGDALGGRGPCQETRRVHVHRAVSRGRR